MDEFVFSNHAKEQIQIRNIQMTQVIEVLKFPQQIVTDWVDRKKAVCQSIFEDSYGEKYLIRVFVNTSKEPKNVITVYKTSKIQKYWIYETDL